MNVLTAIALVLAVVIASYLLVALFYPEKFQ